MNKRTQDFWSKFDQSFIGFDNLWNTVNTLAEPVKYPKYNIIRPSDSEYVIEMAVAGFKREELDITIADDQLVIAGKIEKQDEEPKYTVRNLAKRSFESKFNLYSEPESVSAKLEDGILAVSISFAEEKAAESRKIDIK